MSRSETECATGAFLPDDGTCSHESAGHAPGSYRSSAIGFAVALVGIVACLIGAIVCAWVKS